MDDDREPSTEDGTDGAAGTDGTVGTDGTDGTGGGKRERPFVLLVDADAHDREIYGRILSHNGFDVTCAADGKTGLRLVRRHHPDLVVLDVGVPDLAGLDLCAAIRTRLDTADIPIIALSAYGETRMGDQARLAGCTRYIEKPASPTAVVLEVMKLVGKPPAGAGTMS